MESAIGKEKAMKKWLRKWKLDTIEKTNPDWRDLWPEITGENPQTVVSAASPVIPAPSVIPAQAGIQQKENASDSSSPLDSRIRENDGVLGDAR